MRNSYGDGFDTECPPDTKLVLGFWVKQFAPLVTETARTFTIAEGSADKTYMSLENFETVAGFGTAFMAFKQNATGAKGGLFQKMFHYFRTSKKST